MAPRSTAVRALYDLAAMYGVGIGEACDRAGIARSSPPRWKRGTVPRANQLTKLRQAILALAKERGALPGGVNPGAAEANLLLLADVQTIIAAAKRLESALSTAPRQA